MPQKRGEINRHVGKDGRVYRSLRFTDQHGERQRETLGVVAKTKPSVP
jgi:hypothetical protein